jgi:hypothetical protein
MTTDQAAVLLAWGPVLMLAAGVLAFAALYRWARK